MDRQTRDKVVSGTKQDDLTIGNACWETPPIVFAKLNEDFGPFDIDLTADRGRALCPVYLGPDHVVSACRDALTARWSAFGSLGYSNPPYGRFIQSMLAKAKQEAVAGFTSVLLLPMRTTKAFHAHVLDGASELLFCSKRLTFFENGIPRLNEALWKKQGRPRSDGAVFDSIVVIYRPGVQALRAGAWQVPKHVTKADLERAAERRREQERKVAAFTIGGRSLWEETESA